MNNPTITLSNGVKIPQLGLGMYDPSFGDETYQAVLDAIKIGYRHVDTATVYRNEDQVGRAIKDSGVSRGELFITTKVWDSDQGYDKTLRAYENSLKLLGLDYVDLYLVHWPVRATRKEAYQALEDLYKRKLVRAIGVSNYLVPHLEELLTYAEIIPAVNQFEITPYLYSAETVALCHKHKIQVESYSPLVRGKKESDPRLVAIAKKYNKSTYQVLIRWALDHGFVTIPKSSDCQRIKDNFDVFDFKISTQDLDLMDTFHDGTRVAPDPNLY
jgi:methylglyoxal/glyoxal reductase